MSTLGIHDRARVLIVDDDGAFRSVISRELEASGYSLFQASNGAQARNAAVEHDPDVILLDLRMPGEDGMSLLEHFKGKCSAEIIVLTGHGTVQTAIRAMKLGAADYLAKPCDLDELEITIERTLEKRSLKQRTEVLERGLSRPAAEMIGASAAFIKMMNEVQKAAQSRSPVLVSGESGTGKELVAAKLHQLGPAANKPFVVVDCTSLSPELMQSELLGHEKGAFTGAVERKHGLFEVADGGTLFLDEIAEVQAPVQAKLLRVLDNGSFRRAGATKEISVDVRIVSASNRSLDEMVASGAFREDLYYRLSPLSIAVPPLRERSGDIPLLAGHFFAQAVRSHAAPPRLSDEALHALDRYEWPGNIRELRGALERLLVFTSGAEIGAAEVEALLEGRRNALAVQTGQTGHRFRPSNASVGYHSAATGAEPGEDLALAEVERRHIVAVLRHCDGHRAAAARILGISERTLYRKLGALGLDSL